MELTSMADANDCAEPALPTKRIPDLTTEESPNEPKKPKLDNPDNNGKQTPQPLIEKHQAELDEKLEKPDQNKPTFEEEQEPKLPSNGKPEIDRKGKGILIEEDDEDDDDDDSDSDSDSDDSIAAELSDESDFADDPLAEVDLDNILPSRTRRKIINPGAYLATDLPEEDSDESDDPDA
ncbi:histone H2A.Z-specific chaperone CHZ1-like [Amaranthus tricolor]|uniref:histone H2A.Z-specific chaperone CHZ1-like n=1 Tax=Amaranthus tricolor TaxID=29722 RepID=UPI00258680AC|nr:histone H2A.Z-specific chaperone CHZ1-like [Amaranthus tricolor]